MARYVVRETLTLIRYIEAENEADALSTVNDMGAGDFDEVDCSPRGANKIEIELDTDQS